MKKRYIAVVLILILTMMSAVSVSAADGERPNIKKVTVGVCSKNGFAYKNANGSEEGYAIDYLNQLGAECGYDIDVVIVENEKLFDNLVFDRCDFVLTDDNPEKYPEYISTQNSLVNEYDVLYVKEDADVCYDEYDKFDGMVIGLCRGSIAEDELKIYSEQNDFTYQAKYYANEEEMLLAIAGSEVDAAVMGSLVYIDKDVKNVAVIGKHDYRLLAKNDMQQDIDNFDYAVSKYMSENNSYINNLYNSLYWHSKAGYPALTRDEHEYVLEHPIVKVGYIGNSYPLQYTDDNGNFGGIVKRYFDFFSEYTGFEFEYYEYKDSDACKQDIIDGKIDMIALVPYYMDWAKKNNMVETSWFLQVPMYEVKLNPDTKARKIGMTSSFAVSGQAYSDNITYINYNSVIACLDAVKNGEIDAAYINGYSWKVYSEKAAYSMLSAVNREENEVFSSLAYMDSSEINVTGIINKAIMAITLELSKNRTINGVLLSVEKTNGFVNFIVKYRLYICLLLVIFVVCIIAWSIFNKKRKEETLEKLAYTDYVTGGMNQSKFYIEGARVKNREGKYAVGYINIQNFKYINDFYGREQGDNVLKVMAHMLDDLMQPDGIYARMSADRFAFLVNYIDYETLKYNFDTYISDIEINISGFSDTVNIKSTCGVYLVENSDESIRDMVDKAAIAEKRARLDSRKRIILYDAELNAEFVKNQEMTSSMKKALENNEFAVYMQPKVDIDSEVPVGCEALVRWISPEKGFISPGDFIPLFEKNGFVTEVDFYVLEQVCRMLRRRIDEGLPVLPVNVNQSRLHVNDRMYLSMLQDMLNKYNLPMNLIVFEITESAFINDSHAMIDLINRMKSLGFKFSIDDFGSGYSSFNLLKDMQVDELKIDKEFLESTEDLKRSRYIIERIVQMAHGLDIRVVCEGVERIEQVQFLREIECDIIQGYYYSKPMPMDEYEKYLENFDLKH